MKLLLDNLKFAFTSSLATRTNQLVLILSSVVLLALYYWALTQSAPLSTFVASNSLLFVSLQFIFIFINVLLGGLAITLIVELTKRQRQSGNMNIFQALISLFVSIATTGCYICGNILVPALGLASSFATLPLGGLEVKILSALLLLYSLNDISHKLKGTCKLYPDRFVKFDLSGVKFTINLANLQRSKSAFISIFLVGLIFLLPYVLPQTGFSINDPSKYSCNGGKL